MVLGMAGICQKAVLRFACVTGSNCCTATISPSTAALQRLPDNACDHQKSTSSLRSVSLVDLFFKNSCSLLTQMHYTKVRTQLFKVTNRR